MRCLFVPGFAVRPAVWEEIDLPGLTAVCTAWPEQGITTLDDAGRWVAAEAERTGVEAVVGHSLGGIAALHAWGRMGRVPVPRLVVVDSFLTTPHPMFRNHVWGDRPVLAARVAAMLAEERPRYPALQALVRDLPLDAEWARAAAATGAAFIWGGRGSDLAPEGIARLAGLPEGAVNPVFVVPDASHFLMLEQPSRFRGALEAALGISDREERRGRSGA